MEVITGVAPAEYGDKSSLVVHIVTKSGLDQPKPTGSVSVRLRFVQAARRSRPTSAAARTPSATSCRSAACRRIGSSIRRSSTRCTITGDSVSFFDRLDAHAGATSTFHLNVQAARSSFDVPNTFDQNDRGQDQHQKINTFNVAPGYSQVIGAQDAVHGQRLRPAGSPDLHAERGSVRRSAGERVAGSQADEHRRQGRRRATRPAATT